MRRFPEPTRYFHRLPRQSSKGRCSAHFNCFAGWLVAYLRINKLRATLGLQKIDAVPGDQQLSETQHAHGMPAVVRLRPDENRAFAMATRTRKMLNGE